MSKRKILDLIRRHTPTDGLVDVPIEGLQLIRVTAPIPTVPSIYPASICVLAEGEKRVYLGGETMTYGSGSFLCCTMPLPVKAEVPRASPSRPVLGLLLSLTTQSLTETLVATEATVRLELDSDPPESAPGLVVCPQDQLFNEAVLRLLQLLDDPEAREVLGPSRIRELYFALLRTRAGGVIRQSSGASRDLGRALAYLRDHIGDPTSVEELARVAGMSKAVFHRRFKAATMMSPLQFIKATRLNNAAALIAGGMTIAEAAFDVGYRSPSQFSREFARQYGVPPRQWADSIPQTSLDPRDRGT